MFIVIENDVFDGIETINNAYDVRIEVLDSLFELMYRCRHIVFSELKNLYRIKGNRVIGIRTSKYVSWLIREYTRVYSCKSIVKQYISVSTKYNQIGYSEGRFDVPIDMIIEFSETKLLTENETDAVFYQQISNYVYRNINTSPFYSVRFENDSYHGANGKSKIEQLSESEVCKCVLCVVDTDKDYPEEKRQPTCAGVAKAVKKARDKKRIVIGLFELPVREKENLLPAKTYRQFSDVGLIDVIATKYADDEIINCFFDIKDGVKYKKIKSPNNRWIHYYQNLIKDCQKAGICNDNNLDNSDDESVYILGIGEKLCDSIAIALFTEDEKLIRKTFSNMSKEKLNYLIKNKLRVIDEIPSYEIRKWEQIAKELFAWGCCLDKKMYPAQRDW